MKVLGITMQAGFEKRKRALVAKSAMQCDDGRLGQRLSALKKILLILPVRFLNF